MFLYSFFLFYLSWFYFICPGFICPGFFVCMLHKLPILLQCCHHKNLTIWASLLCITIRIILESWLVYWGKTARGGDHRIICLPSCQKDCQTAHTTPGASDRLSDSQHNTWCIRQTDRQTHTTPGASDKLTDRPTQHLVHQTD